MKTRSIAVLMVICGAGILLMACDPLRKRECEWYLVPEPLHRELVDSGWVSLCARNYVTNRQKCYFKATLELSERVYGKTIRYSELEFDNKEFPRRIDQVVTCEPKRKRT